MQHENGVKNGNKCQIISNILILHTIFFVVISNQIRKEMRKIAFTSKLNFNLHFWTHTCWFRYKNKMPGIFLQTQANYRMGALE